MTPNSLPVCAKPLTARKHMLLVAGLVSWLGTACIAEVQMKHEPIVATSGELITSTAEAEAGISPDAISIDMFVAEVLVQSCTSSPCVYVGGPYAAWEND